MINKWNLNYYFQSNDGIDAKTFHDLCDYQSPTIVLIERRKGYQFGGFTTLDWYTEKCE